jgi:hypothetical protein
MQLAAKQPGRKPISRRRRFDVLEKYGYKCIYCGRGPEHGVVLQVDHAEPVARGGENDDENLVASCVDCNLGKRDRIVAVPTRTFLGWLRGQKGRDDIVGDLARDEERWRLIEPVSFKHLTKQLRQYGAGNTWVPDGSPIGAAWHAWREYRRGGKPTILIEKLRAHDEEVTRRVDEANARSLRESEEAWARAKKEGK